MNPIARLYVRTSVVYLVLVALGGVYLFVDPNHAPQLRSVHSHALLIGWVTMGLAGLLLARGRPPEVLAKSGWVVTNLGLLAMSTAWMAEAFWFVGGFGPAVGAAGGLELFGLLLVAAAVWKVTSPVADETDGESPEEPAEA